MTTEQRTPQASIPPDSRQVGDVFKSKRMELGLSLKEVENATSIRMMYLQAIEEGRIAGLISSVYASGFVKQYATFLEMDGDRIIKEHPGLVGVPKQQVFAYGIGTLEGRGGSGSGAGLKALPNAIWVGASIAVLLGAWYFARFMGVL